MGNLYSKDHCFVLWFTSRLAVWNPVPWGVLLEMLAHQQARQRSVHSWVKSITLFLATAAKYWKKTLPGTCFGFPTSLQVIDDFFSILLRQILLNNFTTITKPSKQHCLHANYKKVVVDLHHGCVDACSETFNLQQGKLSVGCCLSILDTQFFVQSFHDVFRTS